MGLSQPTVKFLKALRIAQASYGWTPYEFNVLESVAAIETGKAVFEELPIPHLRFAKMIRCLCVGDTALYVSGVMQLARIAKVDLVTRQAKGYFATEREVLDKSPVFVGALPLQYHRRLQEQVVATNKAVSVAIYNKASTLTKRNAQERMLSLDTMWRTGKRGLIDVDLYQWSLENLDMLMHEMPDQHILACEARLDGTTVGISVGARVSALRWANVIRRQDSVTRGLSALLFQKLVAGCGYPAVNDGYGDGGGGLDQWKRRCGLQPKVELCSVKAGAL